MHGLVGYREVIECIQWGLISLGSEATAAVNQIADNAVNIVFGFQMLQELDIESLPSNTILYNLEQISNLPLERLKPVFRAAARRLHIWDYSQHNLQKWEELRPVYPVAPVPIGWAPPLARITSAPEQDIDVLFYGGPSDLRLTVFSALCHRGIRSVFVCGLYGASRDGLIARSKLVLNLNMYSHSKIFEIVRVSYLLANSKAVIADLQPETFVEPDIREAVAFAPPSEIANLCGELLKSESSRTDLAKRGEAIIRKRDIREILQRAMLIPKTSVG